MPTQVTHPEAKNIRRAMFEADLSQRDLARLTGMSQSGLYRRLSGEVEFKLAELRAIAEALKVPVSQIVEDQAA